MPSVGDRATIREVQARWAYSELLSPRIIAKYSLFPGFMSLFDKSATLPLLQSFVLIGQKLGVGLQVIEAVLGHTGGSRSGIVKTYQRHSFAAEKYAPLEAWGAHVGDLI
jgi:hypothetical protein